MYSYQGRAVRAGSAKRAVKVFFSGALEAVPRGRGRDGEVSKLDTSTGGCSARAQARRAD